MIEGVHLEGGPCDGETPEAQAGTTYPDDLDAITVMDHERAIGHVYAMTERQVVGWDGTSRRVLEFRRTLPRRLC